MADEKRLNLHILRVVPIVVGLGLLIHFLLPRLATIEDSLVTLRRLSPWAVALALVAEAFSYVANGAVLQSVVRLAGQRMRLRRAIAVEIGAGTVALVAGGPLGFGAAIYKWTRGQDVSAETAMLASWLPSVFDSATLILFAMLSAAELLLAHRLSRTTIIALVIVISVLAAIISAAVVLLARNDWMKRVTSTETAERAAHAWRMMHRGGWQRAAFSSIAVVGFDVLCLKFVFIASGQHIPLSLLLAGYGVPMLLGRASLLPGGIAVIEVAMAALFGGLGVPANVAVVVVLTYRLISFWLPALVGIPIAIALQGKKTSM